MKKQNNLKKLLAYGLVLAMLLALLPGTPIAAKAAEATDTYTLNYSMESSGVNWNPHAWRENEDSEILSYLETPLASMSISDSQWGTYQWVYEAAAYIEDVTAEHRDDLTKYAVSMPEGKSAEAAESGYVFEIGLNPEMAWEDGTPINADSYIYSMKALLDPAMKNYRANNYYSGDSAVAGGMGYYYAGSTAFVEDATPLDAQVAGDPYTAANGDKLYFALRTALSWLGGETLETCVNNYGADYLDVEAYESLEALADEDGYVPVTGESIELMTAVISVPAWGEGPGYECNYVVAAHYYPECGYDETVGCYKVDEYTIRYVAQTAMDINSFLMACSSNWLVYEGLYEAGKYVDGDRIATSYGTSLETTKSYGPYRLESFVPDVQMVFVQNENWYGFEKQADGSLRSYTDFLVDGERRQQYQATRVIYDVMDYEREKEAFLKGELSEWSPSGDELAQYAGSDRLYKVDETFTQSFFFNTDVEALKIMDASKGNTNSVVLSNRSFRKAFSLAIDREELVKATAGYKPAFFLMNSLYFYDIYNDPSSSYRNSVQAMEAMCRLYGVEYGEGKAYANLREAYLSIDGCDLETARTLMAQACAELVAEGLYTAGEPIVIRIGWTKVELDGDVFRQIALLNRFINAAAEGSGFGTITFEAVGNIENRYSAVPQGEFAVGYGAWGGAAFYPFRNFQVYFDTEQFSVNELGCWDPASEMLTLNVYGEDVTMSWQEWSRAMVGDGPYTVADFQTKLDITARMEELYLKKYYRIPLMSTTACSLLSRQVDYYTENYNIMYGFGGMRLMKFHYTDAQWKAYVAENGLDYGNKIKLELWTYPIGGWGDEAQLRELMDAFEASNPDIAVDVRVLDYTSGDALINEALEAGNGPDILIEGPERLVAAWGEEGYLVDLSELLDETDVDEIYGNALRSGYGRDGGLYEYPLFGTVHTMAINRNVFEDAGALQYLNEQTHTWNSTEDFFKAVQAVHSYTGDTVGMVYYGGIGGDQGTRALVNNLYGGTYTNADHTAYTWDSPENIQALDALYGCEGIEFNDSIVGGAEINLLVSGELPMAFCWNINAQKMNPQTVEGDEILFLAFPTDGEPQLCSGIWGMGVVDSGDQSRIDAAKRLVKHFCDSEATAQAVAASGYFPIRDTVHGMDLTEALPDDGVSREYHMLTRYMGDYYPVTANWVNARNYWLELLRDVGDGMGAADAAYYWNRKVNKDMPEQEEPLPDSGVCGENLTWKLEGGLLLISGQGDMYDYDPAPMGTNVCTAPWGGQSIDYIIVEEGVTSIGDHAFRFIDAEEVILADTVREIGYGAFDVCTNLTQVRLPEGLEHIRDGAFSGTALTRVTIPETVSSIGHGAFSACGDLQEITFEGSAPSMEESTFAQVRATARYRAVLESWNLASMQNYGGDLTWVAYSDARTVASGWSGYTTWELTEDGALIFSGSGTMKTYGSKTEMPWYKYLDQITCVVLNPGVANVSDYAFYGMPNLERLVLPETLTAIGMHAFKNCVRLDGVNLPAGLTKLGESAFYGCSGLTAIEIPASLWTIQPYTFKNCTELTEVTFREGNLQKISDGAFYGTGLTALMLPDCLDILDVYAFKNCTRLSSIELGSGLTELREAVFYGTAIPTITIPEGITKIGPYVFKNCVALETIDLPESLTSVGEASFYACTSLKSLDLPDAVTKIGNYAFRKCEKLRTVSLSEGLVNIGESSFYGCKSLYYLIIPKNVTTIQGYAFKGCTSLSILILPDSLKTLGDSAFHSCTGLDEITIPGGVTKLGEYCFSGSTGIHTITFQGSAPAIGTGAFRGLNATAYYPSGNSTWTAAVRQSYGGKITWKAK